METVGDGLQDGHGAVVPGVAVVFGFHVPDLLERIDQNEVDRRVLCEEIHELLLQTVSDHLRFRHDPDPPGVAVGHVHQTALDAGERIFETQVQHLPRPAVEIPDRLPGGNAMRHPESQPGLTRFGRTGKDVQTVGDQLVHQEGRLGKLHVHDLIGGENVKLRVLDPQHPAQMADGLLRGIEAVVDHHVVHHVAPQITGFAEPVLFKQDAAVLMAFGADGELRRPVPHVIRLQIVDEVLPELGPQGLIDLRHGLRLAVICVFAFMASPFFPGRCTRPTIYSGLYKHWQAMQMGPRTGFFEAESETALSWASNAACRQKWKNAHPGRTSVFAFSA